ncbi:mannitol dehydrogenase family protein [Labrys monachus]|uniref:Mannitol 2-dehydrogenase/sorbose reductase n=1 Tax=Labrys monachus TaxID=217067 RepID=A0ABU0FB94_9HYPH|nr:mannitol dehydrogenase family protein [Labrys monachus]MDQ0391882.1 mannitol 2-dehydrogenase/sorbose reductase [Labrys monachus]
MIELSERALDSLPPHVRVPRFDRRSLRAGIVHIGVGNFHRVHQALVIDDCLEERGNEGWAICGVGIVPGEAGRAKAATYRKQDYLYTVTEFAADGSARVRVVGAMINYLHAPGDPEAVLLRMSSPDTRIVSLTITEGGYDRDKVLAEHDPNGVPRTAFDFIVEALERRRNAGFPPFTVMSCDNLRSNGDTTRAIVLALARATNPGLADWIEREGAFPNSMVDRIAPRVSADDRRMVNGFSGIEDAVPAICEVYTNWVMEDRFCNGRPPFKRFGVTMRDDVALFESIKGRLSNAAHMMLCYPAVLLGYRLINEAMGDHRLVKLLRDFWRIDAIPLVTPPAGVSPHDFTEQVIERFANKGINDQVLRVAHDGASKIMVFHSKTISQLIAGGGALDREAFMLACFARYLFGRDGRGQSFPVDEPQLSEEDWTLARSRDPLAVLRLHPFRDLHLAESGAFRQAFARFSQAIAEKGVSRVLDELVA